MKDLVKIIIPSHGRPAGAALTTSLLLDSIVLIHKSEAQEYLKVIDPGRLKFHELTGIAAIRQSCLNMAKRTHEYVFMADDDITGVECHIGRRSRRIEDPATITQIVTRTALLAKEAGAAMFGFSMQPNPIRFDATQPFGLRDYIDAAFGVRTDSCLKFDQKLQCLGGTFDLIMQCLRLHRFVLQDRRFRFDWGKPGVGSGGLRGLQTRDAYQEAVEYLSRKWSPYASVKGRDGRMDSLRITVPRKSDNTPYR